MSGDLWPCPLRQDSRQTGTGEGGQDCFKLAHPFQEQC